MRGTYGASSSDMYCGADQLRLLKAHNEILKYILKGARMCKGKCAHVYGFWLKDELQHFRCFVKGNAEHITVVQTLCGKSMNETFNNFNR